MVARPPNPSGSREDGKKKYPANPGSKRDEDDVLTDWRDVAEDDDPVKPAGPPRRDR